jgi:hypothetical protein
MNASVPVAARPTFPSTMFVHPLLSEVIVRIGRPELGKIVLEVAEGKFDGREFGRRSLMNAVEERVRELGAWTQSDDSTSGSRGLKSKGLANIDWCIADLKKKRRLLNVERDKWKLPPKSRT